MISIKVKRLVVIITIGIVIIIGARLIIVSRTLSAELNIANAKISVFNTNSQVLDFTNLFIDKVLESDTSVDFDTRLTLENSVRNIKDDQILSQWNKFTGSKNEADAQQEVKTLLKMLVAKIQLIK